MIELSVPISPGELIDKLTILEIKSQRMTDAAKLANVNRELELLKATWQQSRYAKSDVQNEWQGLRRVNEKLWDIEDQIRDLEREQRFERDFIELARAVYFTNDERASLKHAINRKLGSSIIEEKSYASYAPKPPV